MHPSRCSNAFLCFVIAVLTRELIVVRMGFVKYHKFPRKHAHQQDTMQVYGVRLQNDSVCNVFMLSTGKHDNDCTCTAQCSCG